MEPKASIKIERPQSIVRRAISIGRGKIPVKLLLTAVRFCLFLNYHLLRQTKKGGISMAKRETASAAHSLPMLKTVGISGHHWPRKEEIEKEKTPENSMFSGVWRRRRDSNPRYPFEVYTISNRARSTSYATSPCCSSLIPAANPHNLSFDNRKSACLYYTIS